jgi:hypothetical protein
VEGVLVDGHANRVRRPSTWRSAALVMLTWLVAAACVVTVMSETRIGPVVFNLTMRHGIHLGDAYAAIGSTAIALLITDRIVTGHMNRMRRWRRPRP